MANEPQSQVVEQPKVYEPHIPDAVKAMGARAAEIQQEYIESIAPETPETPVVVAPVVPVTPVEPEPTAEEIDAVLAQPSEQGSELRRLQHAYKSLRGRMQSQSQTFSQRIEQLNGELMTRSRAPAPQPTPAVQPEIDLSQYELSAEERENLGDLADVIERVATGKAMRIKADFEASLMPQLAKVEEQNAIQRETVMVQELDRILLPAKLTFEQINQDPRFLEWLQLTDPMAGVTRNALLQQAWSTQDGPRVLAISKAFLGSIQPPAEPSPEAPSPATLAATPPGKQPAAPRQPTIAMETLAAPGRGKQGSAPSIPEKPLYTRQEVKDFYQAKASGLFRGREAEADGYDREIALASAEGRIR